MSSVSSVAPKFVVYDFQEPPSERISSFVGKTLSVNVSEKLGDGAFAEVNAGKNPRTHSPWAIKRFDFSKKDLPAMMQKETNILRLVLGAPHTVQIRAILKNTEGEAIAMNQCPGKELFHWITERPFFIEEIFHIARQGLEALQFYQSKEITHGDIKPENCMYENRILNIIDFGSAGTVQSPSRNVGTLASWPPETALDRVTSFASDMWGLGVMLFEIYTHSRFFLLERRPIELIQYAQQLEGSFLQRLAKEKKGAEDTEEQALQKAEAAIEKFVKETPEDAQWYRIPWRGRIWIAHKEKNDSQPPDRLVEFLEKIFTEKGSRMTPEQGLKFLAEMDQSGKAEA